MQEAVKLMAAICLVPPDGHEKTLEAITIAGEMKGAGGAGGARALLDGGEPRRDGRGSSPLPLGLGGG